MKIALCIIAGIVVFLHTYAAISQIRKRQNKNNEMLMIIGAVLSVIGITLCLVNNGIDWLVATAGFTLIVYACIQNGRQNQNFHIQHHIVRISLFSVLTVHLFAYKF